MCMRIIFLNVIFSKACINGMNNCENGNLSAAGYLHCKLMTKLCVVDHVFQKWLTITAWPVPRAFR